MLRTIVNADPVYEFRAIEDMFDKLFGSTHHTPASTLTLPVDIVERDGSLQVKAAVPGLDPNDIDVSIEKNVLTIRGETRHDKSGENDKIYRRELWYGSFSRSIRLPEGLDLDAVRAEFTHGLVTINLPKVPEQKPKALKVPVQVTEPAASPAAEATPETN